MQYARCIRLVWLGHRPDRDAGPADLEFGLVEQSADLGTAKVRAQFRPELGKEDGHGERQSETDDACGLVIEQGRPRPERACHFWIEEGEVLLGGRPSGYFWLVSITIVTASTVTGRGAAAVKHIRESVSQLP